ncbi:hypothetical protein TNCV_2485111 [Trichonephila clavipes]|uniref:Uncharacterized protein n=1 Tax=Trichonephila clavipes TaxID=2585209 RepID=A0A8X6W028_TRICX|nr:hypothetical protein TNCV_2485111 [Trichonephila clavipes]
MSNSARVKFQKQTVKDRRPPISSWFVAILVRPSLRVKPLPKSADFHDAENRQRPCRMIMRHVKDFLVPFRIVRAQVSSSEETGCQTR